MNLPTSASTLKPPHLLTILSPVGVVRCPQRPGVVDRAAHPAAHRGDPHPGAGPDRRVGQPRPHHLAHRAHRGAYPAHRGHGYAKSLCGRRCENDGMWKGESPLHNVRTQITLM